MGLASLFTAFLFASVGIFLIWYLGKNILFALVGDKRGWLERWKFKNKTKTLSALDVLIEESKFDAAWKLLQSGFFFEQVRVDSHLIDRVSNFHLSLLGRILNIFEKQSKPIPSFAIIEDLIVSRGELMRAYIEAYSNKRSLLRKRRGEMPIWAHEEFKKKILDLEDKLITNRKSIGSQLNELARLLGEAQGAGDITYH